MNSYFGKGGDHLRSGLEELYLYPGIPDEEWERFVNGDGTAGLRGLSLHVDDKRAATLAASPNMRDLRRLWSHCRLSAHGLESLARLPLRSLILIGGKFDLGALACLRDGACGQTLEELELNEQASGNVFPTTLGLGRLRRLRLTSRGLGLDEPCGLARSGILGRLDELALSNPDPYGRRLAPLPVAALLSGDAPGPRTLRLSWCSLKEKEA